MICYKYKCIFIRIPKTASSSLSGYFIQNLGGLHGDKTAYLPPMREHGLARILNLFPDYFTFTFVRNPFDRFISCWLNRFDANRITDGSISYHSLYEYAEFAIDLLQYIDVKTHPSQRIGPQQVLYKECIYDRHHLRRQEDFLLDYHPQCYFGVKRVNDIPCSFIGRFEKLDEDFHHLLDVLAAPHSPLAKANVSTNRQSNGDRRHYSDYYDKASQRLVEKLYGRDLELLGYEFEREGKLSVPKPLYDIEKAKSLYRRKRKAPLFARLSIYIRRLVFFIKKLILHKLVYSNRLMRRVYFLLRP